MPVTRLVLSKVSLAGAVLFTAACGQAVAPTASPSATPIPAATSAGEFASAFCSSLQSLARAVGNPDTAADSVLSAALDEAIRKGDPAAVDEAAGSMQAELEAGRRLAAVAAGWAPGAAAAGIVDRLIAAFVAMVEAKRSAAGAGLTEADARGQAALVEAGGLVAWQELLHGDGVAGIPSEASEQLKDCRWWEAGAPSLAPGGPSPQPGG
jgi:hypothetical protein